MKTFIKRNVFTVISLVLGLTTFLLSAISEVEVFELFANALFELEYWQIDELIIPIFLLILGLSIDNYKKYLAKNKLALINESKLKSLRITMRTVQDIVGNALNQLILFKMDLEQNSQLNETLADELDSIIRNTSEQINKLAQIKRIQERRLGDDMYVIDVENSHQ